MQRLKVEEVVGVSYRGGAQGVKKTEGRQDLPWWDPSPQSRPATVGSQPPEQVGQACPDFISKGKLSMDSCQAAQRLGLQSSKIPGFRGEDHCRT